MTRARLRHLQALAAVAEYGSITRAAQAMGVTQPAVTLAIHDLEALLEATLFHRLARGVQPTPLALELLPFVRRALAAVEEGVELVALRNVDAQGLVRIGAIEGAVNGLLVRALPAFSAAHPTILVDVRQATAAETSMLIAHREIDLMLCRPPAVIPENWAFSPLIPDHLVVVAGPQHPLAGRRSLAFGELLDQPWMLLPSSSETQRRFDELLLRHQARPVFKKLKTRLLPVIQAFLQAEPLLLLAPCSIVRQLLDADQLVALDVREPLPFSPIGLLSPSHETGEAAALLAAYLRRHAGALA